MMTFTRDERNANIPDGWTVLVDGVEVFVKISPYCWMYKENHSGFSVCLRDGGANFERQFFQIEKPYMELTKEEIDEAIHQFLQDDGVAKLKALSEEFAVITESFNKKRIEKEKHQRVEEDKFKKQGYKYKVEIVISTYGSDNVVSYYSSDKPTKAQVLKTAKKQGFASASALQSDVDFKVTEI